MRPPRSFGPKASVLIIRLDTDRLSLPSLRYFMIMPFDLWIGCAVVALTCRATRRPIVGQFLFTWSRACS